MWKLSAILVVSAMTVSFRALALVDDDTAFELARLTLTRMTPEEKALLCAGNGTMTLAAIPRVGIELEWRMSDGSHAVRPELNRWDGGTTDVTNDLATVLPSCSALACTWNRDLAYAHGDVLGSECVSRKVNQLLGPSVNLMRTPLGGRNWEIFSEDPVLTAALAVPLIEGIQSHDVAATVKHFCLDVQEDGRRNLDVICDERTLNEFYLLPFRAAVIEANALCLMAGSGKYNGEWMSDHAYLLRGVLRDRWGFTGAVMTDWGGPHSCEQAAMNGCGVELNRGRDIGCFVRPFDLSEGRDDGGYPLVEAVRGGRVPEATLDDMALRTLFVMAKTGFLGGRGGFTVGERNTVRHQNVARSIGEEAIVLMKNDSLTLPLKPRELTRILLVGSMAFARHCTCGGHAEGKPPYEITPAAGIAEYFRQLGLRVEIDLAPLVVGDEQVSMRPIPDSAIETCDSSRSNFGFGMNKAWRADYWAKNDMVGDPVESGFVRVCGGAWSAEGPRPGTLPPGPFAVRYSATLAIPATGRYVFCCRASDGAGTRLLLDGRVIGDDWKGASSAFSTARAELKQGERHELAVEFRSGEGDNFLEVGWQQPGEGGMTVVDTRAAAMKADAVIVFTGTTIGNGRAQEGEGGDRPDLRLPEGHDEAIAKLLSWGCPNLVVVNHSGAPVELPWVDECPTLLQMPYLGQEAGRPLARVLFGDVCPSGRLPCTWPRSLADTAVARKGTMTKDRSVLNERFYVGYRWHDQANVKPMFPFGHGLSYARFEYSRPRTEIQRDGSIVLSVDVRNAGTVAGKETVQVYASYPGSRVERPVRELKGFAKLDLEPGDTKRATIRLWRRDFAYWDSFRHRFRTDAGHYDIAFGASETDIRSRTAVDLEQDVFFDD